MAGLDYVNDRSKAEAYMAERYNPEAAAFRQEQLYAREVVAGFQFGSVLFYRHDTWHRGRPVKPGTRRLVQNLTFTKAGCDWLNVLHPGWSWSMYRRDKLMEKLIAEASVEQRAIFGFSAAGARLLDTADRCCGASPLPRLWHRYVAIPSGLSEGL